MPETIQRFYISGPMTGLPNFNREAFREAERALNELGHIVFNPANVHIPNASWEEYMREDLKLLLKCDSVLVLPGWEVSRGARTEVELAAKLGMKIYRYPDMKEIKLVPIQTDNSENVTVTKRLMNQLHEEGWQLVTRQEWYALQSELSKVGR